MGIGMAQVERSILRTEDKHMGPLGEQNTELSQKGIEGG